MTYRLVKNAFSNLSRGGAAAVVALILPPILIRHMAPSSYAVWVLSLQAAAYLGYLDFGLQTAVGRYIAFANEKKDLDSRDGVFSAAFAGLSIAGVLGLLVVIGLALASHRIFPSVPAPLIPALRITILIVGTSVALGLPASAWNGVFVGLQRYEIPAVTIGAGKVLSAIGLIVAALTGRSLIFMAVVLAMINILSYGMQFALLRRIAPEMRVKRELITKPIVKELSGYCLSLTAWSLSMLLVNGFDLILVGRFEFSAVTPYSACATLITFLAGMQSAVFGVIMPHAAELHARQDAEALGALLIKATRLGVLLLLLTGLPLMVFSSAIIRVWIGSQFAHAGGKILIILVIANMVRLTAAPYASILIGSGQQRLVIVSPVAEGVTNLVASILLGLKYGATGVAWGTLIGAVVGLAANILYNIPRTMNYIYVSQRRYSYETIATPAWCGLPIGLGLFFSAFCRFCGASGQRIVVPALLASCGLCMIFLVKIAYKEG